MPVYLIAMDRFSYCLGLQGLRGGRESFNKVSYQLLQDERGPLLWDFRLHPRTLEYPKAVFFPSPLHYCQPKAHLREGMKTLAHPSLSSKEPTQSKKKTEPTWLQKVEPTFFCNVYIFSLYHLCILNISLSWPRWIQPLSLFFNHNFKINLIFSVLSPLGEWQAVCNC